MKNIMKKSFLICALAAMSVTAFAAEELMTINGKPVTAEEFLYIYEKNNQAGAKPRHKVLTPPRRSRKS